jgi:hypothetical protein
MSRADSPVRACPSDNTSVTELRKAAPKMVESSQNQEIQKFMEFK